MSLFQAREWWAARPDSEEEFDGRAFCIGNIDNSQDGAGMLLPQRENLTQCQHYCGVSRENCHRLSQWSVAHLPSPSEGL